MNVSKLFVLPLDSIVSNFLPLLNTSRPGSLVTLVEGDFYVDNVLRFFEVVPDAAPVVPV